MRTYEQRLHDEVEKQINAIKYKHYLELQAKQKIARKRLYEDYLAALKKIDSVLKPWNEIKAEPVSDEYYNKLKEGIAKTLKMTKKEKQAMNNSQPAS